MLKHSPHILKRCRPLALKSSNNKSHGRSSPDYCRPLHFFSARRVRAEPLGALLSLFCPALLNLYDSRFCRTGLISSRLLVMPPLWPGPKLHNQRMVSESHRYRAGIRQRPDRHGPAGDVVHVDGRIRTSQVHNNVRRCWGNLIAPDYQLISAVAFLHQKVVNRARFVRDAVVYRSRSKLR